MKYIKNNYGYTLIWALLIITIIGILTPPLVSSAINSAKQNKMTEENNQVVKQADMGAIYLEAFTNRMEIELKKAVTDRLEYNAEIIRSQLEHDLHKLPKDEREKIINFTIDETMIDKKKEYVTKIAEYLKQTYFTSNSSRIPLKLDNKDFELGDLKVLNFPLKDEDYPFYIEIDNVIPDTENLFIKLNYTSYSKKNTVTEQAAKLSDTVKINLDINIDIDDATPQVDERCRIDRTEKNNYTELEKKINGHWDVNNKIYYIDKKLDVGKNKYFIDGDLYIKGDLYIMNQGKLWVTGNLFVEGNIDIKNKTELIIEGKLTHTGSLKYPGYDNHGRFCENGKFIEKK